MWRRRDGDNERPFLLSLTAWIGLNGGVLRSEHDAGAKDSAKGPTPCND